MRDPKELLAILTAEVQGYELVDGAIPEYLPEDLAHGMGFIRDKKAALLLGVKYCGRTQDIHDLDLMVWQEVLGLYPNWTKEKCYERGTEFIRKLCQMALGEYMDEHRCHDCNGTSEQRRDSLANAFHKDIVFCDTCGDKGRVYPNEHDRADAAGIHRMLWDRLVARKYRDIQSVLHDLERSAVDDLETALARKVA